MVKEIIISFIVFCVILVPFVRKLESQEFHRDEIYWLLSSKYFKLFFIDRDMHSKEWREYLAYDNPPVGKYILGSAVYTGGYGDEIKEMNNARRWDGGRYYAWNTPHGAMPSEKLLYNARLVVAIFGSLTCFLIYWIGRKAFSKMTGIIASLLLAYNPLMLSCSRRAMTDAPLLFFMTANIALIIFFYQSFRKQRLLRTFAFGALIGINTALAAGTKLNGGLAGIVFAIFCIFSVFMKTIQHKEIKIIAGSLLISGFIAILVFVGINPYLYDQPLKGSVNMVKHRMFVVRGHQEDNKEALTSLDKKFSFVIHRTLFPNNYVILGNIFKVPVDAVLFILGLIALLYAEIKYIFKNYRPSFKSIIIVWTVITFVGIIIWIPLDWDRYYLPLVPCIVMILGYTLDKIINKCREMAHI